MANTPSSLGLPAGDARGAARSASAPWWQALMTVASAAVIAWPYAKSVQRVGLHTDCRAPFDGFVFVNRPKRRGVRPGKGPAAT
jgi:hypothetical protein